MMLLSMPLAFLSLDGTHSGPSAVNASNTSLVLSFFWALDAGSMVVEALPLEGVGTEVSTFVLFRVTVSGLAVVGVLFFCLGLETFPTPVDSAALGFATNDFFGELAGASLFVVAVN
jgi:hypothetical protein